MSSSDISVFCTSFILLIFLVSFFLSLLFLVLALSFSNSLILLSRFSFSCCSPCNLLPIKYSCTILLASFTPTLSANFVTWLNTPLRVALSWMILGIPFSWIITNPMSAALAAIALDCSVASIMMSVLALWDSESFTTLLKLLVWASSCMAALELAKWVLALINNPDNDLSG